MRDRRLLNGRRAVDRWVFLFGVILICCCLYPPFIGVCIGIGIFYGATLMAYGVLGGFMR